MYEKQCPQSLQKLIGAAIISLSMSKTDFAHVTLPECEKLDYEKDLAASGKTCYLSGLFGKSEPIIFFISSLSLTTQTIISSGFLHYH